MKKKILLAEDTRALAENIADILENSGYEVSVAENGLEALKLIPSFDPHLVITDVVMPLMDGLELVRELRRQVDTKSIPVIVMSARTSVEDMASGSTAGATMYLKKPCTADELIDAVVKLIGL